jgi:hypothetical protein
MRYRTIIYVGPSLYGEKIEHLKGELWQPPAKQGDILRDVIAFAPYQIVLIDGTFHQSLSVWVKELVYAMLDGVRFIGASSMGALRAAELHRYGAIGIGSIFNAYKDGQVQDDAWVAMTYDPETYRPITEPPCGASQKRLDALEAIRYAREDHSPHRCKLVKSAITPYLKSVINRVLE